jgi:Lrp/AsnC family leucine-responsive transcriptional regulator
MYYQIESVLDATGWQILEALQEDARISFTELGRRVGMSPPAVAERVRRLEEAGIITGYRAQIDLSKAGFPITAIMRLTSGEDCQGMGATIARNIPEVLECYRVTGTDDYVMKVAAASVSDLEDLINRVSGYGSCITSLVLSTPLSGRIIRKDLQPSVEGLGIRG